MSYRDDRINAMISNYFGKDFSKYTDGKHRQVLSKENVEKNVTKDVKTLGYKVKMKGDKIKSLCNGKKEFKLDSRANNITSSSMLSACFFAYFYENKKIIELIKNSFNDFENLNIDNIDVETEYVDKDIKDSSHFDALIKFKSNNVNYKVFVEVKYCEEKYGPKNTYVKKRMTEKEKEEAMIKYINSCESQFSIHSKFLNISSFLETNGKEDYKSKYNNYIKSDYSKYYQIIRNISRAKEENSYCLFLLAKGNEKSSKQIEDVLGKSKGSTMNPLYKSNNELIDKKVSIAYFEDILDHNSELYKKYFK